MDRKRQSNDRQARNRIQVLKWIIERPALEQRLVDVREGAAEQNGVTVRTGASDRGGTQRTAAAADVFDDHRAEQRFDLFHPWPREGVERSARRKMEPRAGSAASDRFALAPHATPPAARQRPLPVARMCGGEVSF